MLIGIVAVSTAVWGLRSGSSRVATDNLARLGATFQGEDVGSAIPEGAWALQGSGASAVVSSAGTADASFGGLWIQDISPDGTAALALHEIVVEVSGKAGTTDGVVLTRRDYLATVDIASGSVQTLASTSAEETFGGPAIWSPDGTMALVGYAVWDSPVEQGAPHPGEPSVRSFCVVRLSGGQRTCFSDLTSVISYAWSADGSTVLFSTGTAVKTLDLETHEIEEVASTSPEGPLAQAMVAANLGSPASITNLAASSNGTDVGLLLTGGNAVSLPAVIDLATEHVTLGSPNPDNQALAWSPDGTTLAYSVGAATPAESGPEVELHLMNTSDGQETVIAGSQLDQGIVSITEVAWSPSGRYLAVAGAYWLPQDTIDVLSVESGAVVSSTTFDAPGQYPAFVDWGPAI